VLGLSQAAAVAAERGTPYSVCVSRAKKLLKQQAGE